MARYDVNIQDYWWILRKRRFMIICAVILFAAFSYLMGFLRSPQLLYESTSAVKVERASDLTTMLMGSVSWTTWDNVATQSVIITSFPIMDKVARRLGRVPKAASADEMITNPQYSGAVADLRSQVIVTQEPNTNILNITATATNPHEAQEIANTVAKVYQEANIEERNKKILETKHFIEQQMKLQEKRVENAENLLKKFKESTNLLSVDTQTNSMLAQLSAFEQEHEQLGQQRSEIDRQIGQLQRNEVSLKPGTDVDSTGKQGSFFSSLSNRLMELKLRREILLNDYTENNPEVKVIDGELKTIVTTVTKELQATRDDIDSRDSLLEQKIAQLRSRISSLPESAATVERLQHDLETNQKLNEDLKTKYQEVLIQDSGKIQEVTIVKPALENNVPTNSPKLLFNAVTGAIIGLVVGILLALVRESLDTSISTVEEIEEFLKVPVLGVIPGMGDGAEKKKQESSGHDHRSLVVYYAPNSPVAEAYRALRSHFQFSRRETGCKVVLVTSSSAQEGKSYNSVNLALSLAQTGDRVLLIDADLRKPVLHRIFGIDREPGLSDYLWGNCELKDAIKTIIDIMAGKFEMGDLLKTPGLDYLHILTAGSSLLNPWGVLRSPRLREMLQEVKSSYDTIIIDSAPILAAADTSDIASEVDAVVLVYEVGRISRNILRRAKEQLGTVHSKVLGVILNNIRPQVAPLAYQYYTSYHSYTVGTSQTEAAPAAPLTWWQKIKKQTERYLKLPRWAAAGKVNERGRYIFFSLLAFGLLVLSLLWQNYMFIRAFYYSIIKKLFPG